MICCPKCASPEGRSIEAIYCECKTPEKERPPIPEELSRQSAPPARRHPMFWLSLGIVFAILTVVTLPASASTTSALSTCAMLSAFMSRQAMNYNRADLPRLLEYWHRSFICTRCGEVFVPG